jgi:RNA polymerase sporulation-specific sigma factor
LSDAYLSIEDMSDEQLVCLAKKGNKKASSLIVTRFAPMVKAKALQLYNSVSPVEDLAQEGMFGLLSAIYSFKGDGASFKTYASKCVSNSIVSALRVYYRKKNVPVSSVLSLESEDVDIACILTPEDIIIAKDEILGMLDVLNTRLSEFERQVTTLYISGKGYKEIAWELKTTIKSVDNAMQRIHKKLRAR